MWTILKGYIRQSVVLLVDAVIWLLGKVAYMLFFLLGWRGTQFFGQFIGCIIYYTNRNKRRITAKELTLLFGKRFDKDEINNITKRSFQIYYMRQIETVFYGILDKHILDKVIHIEGIENLDIALSKGKGVILLLSHFGSFLLPLPYLAYLGYKINQITGRQIHGSLIAERFWLWRKKEADRLPINFLQVGKFLRPVYRALKDNEIVAIAFDGRDGSRWVTVDFFERKAKFSTGPFELAKKTNATIVPTFVVRNKNNKHTIIMEKPFQLLNENKAEKVSVDNVVKFTNIFTDYIAQYPCHFGMILYVNKKMQESMIGTSLF